MKTTKTIGALLTLFLVTFAFLSTTPAVLAKNVNVPEDEKIIYLTGGTMNVSSPTVTNWPWPYPKSLIQIIATHTEGGNSGAGDSLMIILYIRIGSTGTTYSSFPWAFISTSTELIENQNKAFSGTPVYINRASQILSNMYLVSEDELKVQRHGNDISVDFDPELTIPLRFPATPWWPIAPAPLPNVLYPLVLPAFTMELTHYGGSMHTTSSKTFASVPATGTYPAIPLSGYTLNTEQMGFMADGKFTCSDWSKVETSSTAFVTMHGINTVIPP